MDGSAATRSPIEYLDRSCDTYSKDSKLIAEARYHVGHALPGCELQQRFVWRAALSTVNCTQPKRSSISVRLQDTELRVMSVA